VALPDAQRSEAKMLQNCSTKVVLISALLPFNTKTFLKQGTQRSGAKMLLDLHNEVALNNILSPLSTISDINR